jgi:putative toxin-antitoxin system antitoxin component (TIGR02293 family)
MLALAESVWRDKGEARRFMNAPHAELGGRTPLEVVATEIGARQVEDVIERGRHGLPV